MTVSKKELESSLNIPKDPRFFHILGSPIKIKILKALVALTKETKSSPAMKNLPSPHVSLIAKRAGLNKRTALLNLYDLDTDKIVISEWHKNPTGRYRRMRIFKLNPKIDLSWLNEV